MAMMSSPKRTKRGEHGHEDRFDRINNLPDELLIHMLSFLPTMCAVSTSILSTRWRYLFTLANCHSFDDHLVSYDRDLWFKKFVYKALESHQISPIKKFSLDIWRTYDKSDLKAWVSTAVNKGVQDLHYQVATQEDHELPDGLFMCKTLARLKIFSHGRYGLRFPLSTWLPTLEILDLERVTFLDYDSVERLFSGCESLKELSLRHCECGSQLHFILSTGVLKGLTIEGCCFSNGLFEIDAPNLAYLSYSFNNGVKIIPSWKYSCSLVEAKLKFNYFAEYGSIKKSLQDDRELLKAAGYKATELHLRDPLEVLLPLDEHGEMPDFHNLSRLYLDRISYDAWKCVMSLIDKSPQLEAVTFGLGLINRHYNVPVSPNEPLLPFSCKAKVIEVHNFCADEGSLLRLGHLLGNARVLKNVILYKQYSQSTERVLQISKELSTLPRASKDCRIQLK